MDWNSPEIDELIRRALAEDVGFGDVTCLATIPAAAVAHARIIAKSPLVCAGLPIAERVFRALEAGVAVQLLAQDGDAVENGRELAKIHGHARTILSGERTALNLLAHLSGIATLTHQFVERLAGTNAKIRDTRKTAPGLRALEKYSVRMGGGTNHRIGLYDAILLKENHIAVAGGVKPALDQAHAYVSSQMKPQQMTAYEATGAPRGNPANTSLPIQIELRDERELREALEAGAESVLLDNMAPEAAKTCVQLARSLRRDVVIEISGGITLANARAYAETGADFLSSGALTHSAPAADLTLLMDTIAAK
ncbi:MAG: carboxylating nicotinate-nucleotide diphosphorylase [Candidatus Acidiferrum sp.]